MRVQRRTFGYPIPPATIESNATFAQAGFYFKQFRNNGGTLRRQHANFEVDSCPGDDNNTTTDAGVTASDSDAGTPTTNEDAGTAAAVLGCIDDKATNFDSSADTQSFDQYGNSSCIYASCDDIPADGCIYSDGFGLFAPGFGASECTQYGGTPCETVDPNVTLGCIDSNATNFDENANTQAEDTYGNILCVYASCDDIPVDGCIYPDSFGAFAGDFGPAQCTQYGGTPCEIPIRPMVACLTSTIPTQECQLEAVTLLHQTSQIRGPSSVWGRAADAANDGAPAITLTDEALLIIANNPSSEIGKSYIFEYVDDSVDYMNASRVKVSFDLNIVRRAPSAAIHAQMELPGSGFAEWIFKPKRHQGQSEFTTFVYEADVSPADGFDQFIFKIVIAAGAVTDAGAELLLDNVHLEAIAFGEDVPDGPAAPITNASTVIPGDAVVVYGAEPNIATNYDPGWGQSGNGQVNPAYNPGTGDLVLAYPNFNYQGTDVTETDLSGMGYLHVDIWVAAGTARMVKISPINNGTGATESLVEVPVTPGAWNSVDLPQSAFTGMTWDSVFQMKFDGQFNADGTQNTAPFDIYLDNIYFWSDGGPADVLGCIDENATDYDDTANTQSLDQYGNSTCIYASQMMYP